jgi:hypothetical protein
MSDVHSIVRMHTRVLWNYIFRGEQRRCQLDGGRVAGGSSTCGYRARDLVDNLLHCCTAAQHVEWRWSIHGQSQIPNPGSAISPLI